METIGDRLRKARLEAGIKQESAAKDMKMSRTTLGAIEFNKRAVLAEELPGFAKIYGITVDEILFGNGSELTNDKETGDMNYEDLDTKSEAAAGSDAAKVNIEAVTDYEQMKEKLSMEVVSADRNAEMLAAVPHEKMEDIAVVYKLVIADADDHRDTVLVTNDMLKEFGITTEQLKADALENAPVLRPAELAGLTETIAKMSGMDAEDLLQGEQETTFVAMAQGDQYGAGVLAYPNFLEEAAEKLGGDFFILPSSVHEILLVKDDGRITGQELQKMVSDINAAEVLPADQLTDHAYHYDSKDHVFELADTFEERQAAKAAEMAADKEADVSDHDSHYGGKESVIDSLRDRKSEIAKNDAAKDAVKDTIQKSTKAKGGEAL